MTEWVKVFNEKFQYMGIDTRENVHREGKWHETFHCWFVDEENVYIQKRSAQKKDYPSLFDITVAGHLEASETVLQGVREIEEEVGVIVQYAQLQPVGVIPDRIQVGTMFDYEFAHVYIYQSSFEKSDFTLQSEEVDSLYTVAIPDFIDLCLQGVHEVTSYHLTEQKAERMTLEDFVPHHISYFQEFGKKLQQMVLAEG